MQKSLKVALFCAFLVSAAVPVSGAVQIHAPVKNAPKKSAWKPLTEAEYQSFLRDPDFALADKNLRLIWRDAQRQLPINRLEVIRKQQEEWEKTGRDRDAENGKGCRSVYISNKPERLIRYLDATLVRCSWLSNKFGSFKVGYYDEANFHCGWADYERRMLYVHFNAGCDEQYAVRINSNRIYLPDGYGEIVLAQSLFLCDSKKPIAS